MSRGLSWFRELRPLNSEKEEQQFRSSPTSTEGPDQDTDKKDEGNGLEDMGLIDSLLAIGSKEDEKDETPPEEEAS